jgi:hypothetical protein
MNKLIFTSILCALALPTQAMPTEGLTPYSLYRKELIKMGWKPSPSEFKTNPLEWPELGCGRTFCTAIFRSPAGKKTLKLSVWMKVGLDATKYYVAPAISFEDNP